MVGLPPVWETLMQEPIGPVWQSAKAENNWLVYRLETSRKPGGKPVKRPVIPEHMRNPSNSETSTKLVVCGAPAAACFTFEEARRLHLQHEGTGIGYLPRAGSAMVIIDLDGVVEGPELEWREDVLPVTPWGQFSSTYIEVSVSGTGLHILQPRAGWPELSFDGGRDPVGLIASGSRFCALTFDHVGDVESIEHEPELRRLLQGRIDEQLTWRAEEKAAAEAERGQGGWFFELPEEEQELAMLAMLQALPRSRWLDSYEGWWKITAALREHEHLHDAWAVWSSGGAGFDDLHNETFWNERQRREGARVGIGTIIHHAGEEMDLGPLQRQARAGRAQRTAERMGERMRRSGNPRARQAGEEAQERAETAQAELVLQWHNDPAQAILDARQIEQLLGDRRQVFSVGGAPSYIRRASISIRNPDTEEMEAGLAHVFQPVTDWATMCHGQVRYVAAAGARGRRPDRVIPQVVQKELEARAGALLPPLAAIVQHPCLLPDGRLLTAQGAYYDEASHLWLDIAPVRGEALKFDTPEQAVAWVENEWLRDFAFDDRADCARALTLAGSLLTAQTMLGEDAGPPCYAFTAPQASTGKTVLARVMCSAVTGTTTPTTTLPIEREEMRKVLFAMALQQSIAAVFDNVPRGRVINDPEACQFATDPLYTGRVLGATKMMQVSARMALVFTGNAVNPGGDMIPRSLTVRLRWGGEGSPALRRFDREIISWTMDNRATVLEALRVILTAPLRPGWQAPIGRFPTWSRVVLQPIAQAFGLSAERLVQEWIEMTAEDELSDDFAILADAMTRAGMQQAEHLVPKTAGLPRSPVFTVGELRDFCTEAIARLDGCTPAEARSMSARSVASVVGQFVDLSRGGLVLRRRNLNLGERTDRKARVCFMLVPESKSGDEQVA